MIPTRLFSLPVSGCGSKDRRAAKPATSSHHVMIQIPRIGFLACILGTSLLLQPIVDTSRLYRVVLLP